MPKAKAERFEGFGDARASFFVRLAKNQNKDWFSAHKSEYEEGWQKPMQALLGEARVALDKAYRHAELGEPHVMRIYRDVRFSKDKSPYKTWIGGGIPLAAGKAKMPEMPSALYMHVGADELFAGAGLYMMDPKALARFRAAVVDEKRAKELDAISTKLVRKGYRFTAAETLKKAPKGVDPEHPRVELLKRKGLVVVYPAIPRKNLTSRALLDVVVKASKEAAPLVEWIRFATA
ncbi:MAG: DUF2461 domain-containing protein [Labilithrix sp.]|nr:DUF2461 domain-containing protein [Labilithrix sp.]